MAFEVRNKRLIVIGNAMGFVIPKEDIERESMTKEKRYDITIQEVEA